MTIFLVIRSYYGKRNIMCLNSALFTPFYTSDQQAGFSLSIIYFLSMIAGDYLVHLTPTL